MKLINLVRLAGNSINSSASASHPRLIVSVITLGFYVGAGDPNLGVPVWVANLYPTEPSSHSIVKLLIIELGKTTGKKSTQKKIQLIILHLEQKPTEISGRYFTVKI